MATKVATDKYDNMIKGVFGEEHFRECKGNGKLELYYKLIGLVRSDERRAVTSNVIDSLIRKDIEYKTHLAGKKNGQAP